MRVLLISDRFPPGGGERVELLVGALATELLRAGDAVGVIARRPGPAPPAPRIYRENRNGVSPYWFAGGEPGSPEHCERLERLFAAALSEFVPDVVHLIDAKEVAAGYARLARDRKIAVVVTADSLAANGHTDAAAVAERVICSSRWAAAGAVHSGVDPARVHVMLDGIAIDPLVAGFSLSALTEPGTLVLASIGPLERRSEQHVLLDALGAANLRRTRVVLLGPVVDVRYTRALRKIAGRVNGLELRIFGSFTPVQLPGVLAAVDCAVFPSRYPAPSSVSVREALACGTPAVVARSGAGHEAIVDGANGFIFEPDRPAELAALLEALKVGGEVFDRLRAGAVGSPSVTPRDHAAALCALYEEARSDGG